MDKIDEKILSELDKNPRIPITQLAKKARVSQQVADYRIKKLIEKGIITKFGTIINLKSLRQEHYRIFFTFNSKKEHDYNKVFAYLKEEKGIYWSARIGGKYDLLVVLFVKDFEEFDRFIDNFNSSFPGLIKDYKSCYSVEHEIYRHKYLSREKSYVRYGYNDAIVDVDDLDRYILDKLKDNCRLSALEIAEKRRISYKTVINRVKSLEKKNIILGYRMFMKLEEKKPFALLLSFRNYSRKAEQELINYLRNSEETTQTVRLFGIWNLFIHVRAKDNEQVQRLLIELRDKFDIIDNYEIIPIFEDISINLMPI